MMKKETEMSKISEMSAYELVQNVGQAMTENCSVHYALGYLKATLAQVIAQLPEADRERELRMLRRVLKDELSHSQNIEELA